MRWMVRAAGGLALVATLALTACGGGSSSSAGTAQLRLLNATNGYPSTTAGYASLDLYIDGTQQASNSALAYGTPGGYVGVSSSDSRLTVITAGGQSTALSSSSRSFVKDVAYTLVAYGWAGALKTALLEEDVAAADAGKSKLTVLNLAPDAGSLDVYVIGSNDSLDNATPLASGVAGGSSVAALNPGVGSFRLVVTAASDKSDVRLDASGLALASTQVGTLVLSSGSGGTLVHALLALQKGGVTPLTNTQARARVVGSVAGGGKVTLQTQGSTLAAAATSPSIGSYALIDGAGAAAVTLNVNGTAVPVSSQALPAGGDYTLLVWGDAAAPQLTLVSDDNRLPSVSGNVKMRLVNGAASLGVPLTLQANYSVVAANVAAGTASAWNGNVVANTGVALDVNGTTLSANGSTLLAKGLYSVFVLDGGSGARTTLIKER